MSKKKKLFIVSDVLIDVLAKRSEHYQTSAEFLSLASEAGNILETSPVVLSNLSYILGGVYKIKNVKKVLISLCSKISIVEMNEKQAKAALESEFDDIEDSLQNQAAEGSGADMIITRNLKDYKYSKLPVLTPAEWLASNLIWEKG